MATYRYNLNNKLNAQGMDMVMIHVSYKNELGKYSKISLTTNIHVKPEHWLQGKQKIGKGDYLHDSKNDHLDKLNKKIERLLIRSKTEQIESKNFKNWFVSKFKNNEENEEDDWRKRSIWKDWDLYLKTNKNNWTANTIKGKTTEYNAWNEFAKYDDINLLWGDITMATYHQFINWCYDVAKYKNSTTGRLIKGFKSMMEWCFNENLHENITHKKQAFQKPTYFKTKISFTSDELWKLYNLDLKSPSDDLIRDALCFSCFTGLRYSDIKLLKKANLINGWLHVFTQKMNMEIVVPLNPEAIKLIKKYENHPSENLIPLPSDQKCNKGIHRILMNNGFDREVELIDVVRKDKIRTVARLYDAFTFHCGKKTFISLFKKFGGDTNVAMSITGNTDEKVIRNSYETIDEELKRDQMENVWTTWREQNLLSKN
jgi:integrase